MIRVILDASGEMEVEADAIQWEGPDAVFLRGGAEAARVPAAGLIQVHLEDGPGAYIRRVQLKHPRAYTSWTAEDESVLQQMSEEGVSLSDMAARLGRQPGGIKSRLRLLAERGGIEVQEAS